MVDDSRKVRVKVTSVREVISRNAIVIEGTSSTPQNIDEKIMNLLTVAEKAVYYIVNCIDNSLTGPRNMCHARQAGMGH